MPDNIERLAVLIEANTKAYENAMKRLQQQTDKAIRASSKSVESLDNRLDRLMATSRRLTGILSTAAFAAFIKRSVEAGAKIGDLSAQLSISAEEFQEFSYAITQSGGSQEGFVKAMTGMTKLIGEAERGSKQARAELAALGVSLNDLRGKTPTQQFEILMDRLSRIEDPTQRNATLFKIFGTRAAEMGELATLGANGIEKLRTEARQLGLVIDNQTIAKAKSAGDEIDKIGRAAEVTGIKIGASFAPALEAISDLVTSPAFQEGLASTASAIGAIVKLLADHPEIAAVLAGAAVGSRFAGGVGALGGAAIAGGAVAGVEAGKPLADFVYKNFPAVAAARDRRMASDQATQQSIDSRFQNFDLAGKFTPKPVGGSGYNAPDMEAQRHAEAVQKVTDALKVQLQQLGQTDREKAISTALSRADVDAKSDEAAEIAKLAGTLYDAEQAQKAFNDAASFAGDTIYDAIDGLILKGESFNDVLQNMVTRLAEAALQATLLGQGPLAGLFGTTSATGGVGGLLGALFGGFRAGGGDVNAGRSYVVGEKGPEIFVPRSSGMIQPNGGGSSGRSSIEIMVGVDPKTGNLTPFVRNVAGPIAVQTTQAGLAAYSKQQQRQQLTAG